VKEQILEMSVDQYGSHVIEKMIASYDEDLMSDIYKVVTDNFVFLANNEKGLSVIKKLIIHSKNFETLETIRNQISENALILSQNPFGNYAIQVAFENWSNEFTYPIVQQFFGKFHNLSLQKYSSNVIEHCVERGDERVINKFIEEVGQHSRVLDLMKNSYGNYVVQKVLTVVTGENKTKFSNTIIKNLEKLTDKKLVKKWKNIMNNCLGNLLNTGEFNNNNINELNLSGMSNSSNYSYASHSPQISSGNQYNNLLNLNNSNLNINNNFPRSVHGSPRAISNMYNQFFIENNQCFSSNNNIMSNNNCNN